MQRSARLALVTELCFDNNAIFSISIAVVLFLLLCTASLRVEAELNNWHLGRTLIPTVSTISRHAPLTARQSGQGAEDGFFLAAAAAKKRRKKKEKNPHHLEGSRGPRLQTMMRRPPPISSGSKLCQLRELISSRSAVQSAKRSFVALHASRRPAKVSQDTPAKPFTTRLFTTSKPSPKAKQVRSAQSPSAVQNRFSEAPSPPDARKRDAGHVAQTAKEPPFQQQQQQQQQQQEHQLAATDVAELVAAVDRVAKAFLAQPGIPSEQMTLTALRACGQRDIKLLLGVQGQHSEATVGELQSTAASHLLDLDPGRNVRETGGAVVPPADSTLALRPQDVVDKISEAAYAVVTHPAVVITPQVLREYVGLQVRLGKPETLPQILELYAAKPRPRLVSGSIQYVERNPHNLQNAIDPAVAEAALDAAIEAKHLDAAVGIVESTYATTAARRSKLLRKVVLPGIGFGAAPVAAYMLAMKLSRLQDAMDPGMATNVAFVAILAYVGFTATIGVVAATTANDQMRRVTWAPGTPLKDRWIREDERAAYDKIACAFGFSEEHRYGEEEGEEFQVLREFILTKGMVLDAVSLMPGMN